MEDKQLDAMKGTLKGKIVLLGAMRPVPDLDQPMSFRCTNDELAQLEGSGAPPSMTGPPAASSALVADRQRMVALRQRVVKMMEDEEVSAVLIEARAEGRNINTGLIRRHQLLLSKRNRKKPRPFLREPLVS